MAMRRFRSAATRSSRRGDQRAGRRPRGGARQRLVPRGRAHASCRPGPALPAVRPALRRRHSGDPAAGADLQALLSGHNLLVWLAFLAVPLTWWALYKTRLGLRLGPSARIRRRSIRPASPSSAALHRRHRLRRALRARRHLSVDRAGGRLSQPHDGGEGLHRARRAHLRQMAAGSGAGGLPALRLPRRDGDPAAGRGAARRGPGAGAVHPGAALCADGGAARRLHRQGDAPKASGLPYVKER